MNYPLQAFSIYYPSTNDAGLKTTNPQDNKTLVLSDTLRLAAKNRQDLPSIRVQRGDPSSDSTVVQWPGFASYVRLYLDISSLGGPAGSRHTLESEVTLSLVPSARPVQCEWIALVRQESSGGYVFHRKIEDNLRFTPAETRKSWPIKLTSEEMEEAGGLFVAIQFPGAETQFRLEHFGVRVQSIETGVAAFTACIGGFLEGWTRSDDAVLWIGSEADPIHDGASPVHFGHFIRPLPAPGATAATRALLKSGGDVVAYIDLSSVPASRSTPFAGNEPSQDGFSPQTIEWLYEQGKIELLWRLGDRFDTPELPEPARHALALYRSRALLDMNAAESAYRGLGETTGPNGHFQAMAPAVRRKMRLSFARACLRSGRTREAEAVLQDMLAADPFDWECYFRLSTIVADSDPALQRTYLQIAETLTQKLPVPALTVIIEDLLAQGRVGDAWVRALRELKARGERGLELWLALGNVHLARGDRLNWSASVGRLFAEMGLARPEFEITRDPSEDIFHRLGASEGLEGPADQSDLISVIMTTYNAERTVKAAVRSVLGQSYGNLRLIVVDDHSTDDTVLLLRQMQAQDSRIEILQTPFNAGTYCAKNMALSRFASDYFTFHDSDDWMHPQRLAKHHAAMRADPRVLCTTSRWYRMDTRGAAVGRRGGGYLHDNPASTFFHRSVVERIGYFDSVRVGADTELVGRIRRRFGPSSVQVIPEPLAIGLHHSASLTRSGATAFDEHRYSVPRLAYWESWVQWHRSSWSKGDGAHDLHMPFPHHPRAFPAPAEIVPDRIAELDAALNPKQAERLHAAV